jgi:hypothetical protein
MSRLLTLSDLNNARLGSTRGSAAHQFEQRHVDALNQLPSTRALLLNFIVSGGKLIVGDVGAEFQPAGLPFSSYKIIDGLGHYIAGGFKLEGDSWVRDPLKPPAISLSTRTSDLDLSDFTNLARHELGHHIKVEVDRQRWDAQFARTDLSTNDQMRQIALEQGRSELRAIAFEVFVMRQDLGRPLSQGDLTQIPYSTYLTESLRNELRLQVNANPSAEPSQTNWSIFNNWIERAVTAMGSAYSNQFMNQWTENASRVTPSATPIPQGPSGAQSDQNAGNILQAIAVQLTRERAAELAEAYSQDPVNLNQEIEAFNRSMQWLRQMENIAAQGVAEQITALLTHVGLAIDASGRFYRPRGSGIFFMENGNAIGDGAFEVGDLDSMTSFSQRSSSIDSSTESPLASQASEICTEENPNCEETPTLSFEGSRGWFETVWRQEPSSLLNASFDEQYGITRSLLDVNVGSLDHSIAWGKVAQIDSLDAPSEHAEVAHPLVTVSAFNLWPEMTSDRQVKQVPNSLNYRNSDLI